MKIVAIEGSIKGVVTAFEKGICRHGDTFELVKNPRLVKDADAFIQTNLLKPKISKSPWGHVYEYIAKSNKPFLVNESATFREYLTYTRLGWYSYKWSEGIFGNENAPRDRWIKFEKDTGIKFKDWNSPGDAIVIMGQKEGDSSLLNLYKEYNSFYDWVEKIIIEIRKYSDRPIILRPHPRNLRRGEKLCNRLKAKYPDLNLEVSENVAGYFTRSSGGEGLQLDLKKAHCVITYNSLSGIDSILQGVPTFALEDGSMAWPIVHKNLNQIENLNYNIDITQWQNEVAYCQWTHREHANGESWAHLKPLMFKE